MWRCVVGAVWRLRAVAASADVCRRRRLRRASYRSRRLFFTCPWTTCCPRSTGYFVGVGGSCSRAHFAQECTLCRRDSFYVVSLCAGDNLEGGALSPGVPARLVSSGHGHVQQLDCDRWPVGPCQQFFCGEVMCALGASRAPCWELADAHRSAFRYLHCPPSLTSQKRLPS